MLGTRFLDERLLDTRLFHARLFDPWLLNAWLFQTRCWSSVGSWLAMGLMGLRFRLGFALHLQAMFLQLLRVDRLLGALMLLHVLRPMFSTIGTIATLCAATAAAAAIAPPAARFFALRARRTIAVFGTGVQTWLHRRPRLLLLRTRMPLRLRPALTLR